MVVGLSFIWLNVRGAEVTGKAENILTISKIVVLGIFLVFGFAKFFDAPTEGFQNLSPFFPMGLGGLRMLPETVTRRRMCRS